MCNDLQYALARNACSRQDKEVERVGDHEKIHALRLKSSTLGKRKHNRRFVACDSARARHSPIIASRQQNCQLRKVNSSAVWKVLTWLVILVIIPRAEINDKRDSTW